MQPTEWIDVSKALITPSIALLGAWIALSQYSSNELKRRHELFDRRWKIYETTLAFLYIFTDEKTPKDEAWIEKSNQFLNDTAGSKFIFDQEIYDYIQHIYAVSIRHGLLSNDIHSFQPDTTSPEINQKLIKLKADLDGIGYYLKQQFKAGCDARFSKYMDLEVGPIRQTLRIFWSWLKNIGHEIRGE